MIPPVGGLSSFGPATAAALLIAGYLLVGEPVTGAVLHRRFEAALGRDPRARVWLYQRLLLLEWGLAALAAGVVWVAPGVGWSELGFRRPAGSLSVVAVAVALAVVVALVLTTRAVRIAARRRPGAGEPFTIPAPPAVAALVPRTVPERRWFAAVAVTAGCCEELLYRGLLFAVLSALAPGLPGWLLVLIGGVAFGMAHAYQGASGVVATGAVGAVLTALYLLSGSLLLPILVHVAVDLRILWIPVSALAVEGEVR